MSELDPRARSLLDRAKREAHLEKRDRTHIRKAIDARLARATWVRHALAAKSALGLLVLSGLGIAYLSVRDASSFTERVANLAKATNAEHAALIQPVLAPMLVDEGASEVSISLAPISREHDRRRVEHEEHTPRLLIAEEATPALVAPESTSSLPAELLLLAEARAAISRGAMSEATRALNRHATQFPTGVLAEEREAARVIVACESASDEADSARRRFHARYPHSLLNVRIDSACAPPVSD